MLKFHAKNAEGMATGKKPSGLRDQYEKSLDNGDEGVDRAAMPDITIHLRAEKRLVDVILTG